MHAIKRDRRSAALDAWRRQLAEMPTIEPDDVHIDVTAGADGTNVAAQRDQIEDRLELEGRSDAQQTAEKLHRGERIANMQNVPVQSLNGVVADRKARVRKNRETVQGRSRGGTDFGHLPHQGIWSANALAKTAAKTPRNVRPRKVPSGPISGTAVTC